tara:strand:- start:10769 stop:11425 length:657 start_codon:yes stop_codon:yes gene_type:complete
MTKDHKKLLLWGGAIILAMTATIVIYRFSVRKFFAKTPFKRRSVKIAMEEYQLWGEGTKKETDSSMYSTIKKYWDSLGWNESQWSPSGTPWSSAFISYIMKKSKATEDEFNFASSHSQYITKAIENRKEKKKGFKGYKIDERKVEIGDLVCYARQDGVTYDTKGSYNSHCDLVFGIDGDNAYALGGNVSDSVTKTKIPLTEDGYAKAGNRRFVVIKTK